MQSNMTCGNCGKEIDGLPKLNNTVAFCSDCISVITGFLEYQKRKRKKVKDTSEPLELAEYFYAAISRFTGKVKPPNYRVWSEDFRKMIEIDHRTPDEIRSMINFVTNDPFWQTNILSPHKLREKYDVLAVKLEQKERAALEKDRGGVRLSGVPKENGRTQTESRTGWLPSARKNGL